MCIRDRAKELLKDAKNPVIILCGKVPITQDTTWSMADLPNGKVVRNTGLTTYPVSYTHLVRPGWRRI